MLTEQQLLALSGLLAPFFVAALILLRCHSGRPRIDEPSANARQRRQIKEGPSRFSYFG